MPAATDGLASTEERDQALLKYFWDLASVDAIVRTKCAAELISYLFAKQNDYEVRTGRIESDADRVSPQLRYSLSRLVKGLGSGREGARQGFALALTEVLHVFPFVGVADVLDQIDAATHVKGSMSGQEERDQLFGRVFGFLAVVRSGRLPSDPAVGAAVAERVVRQLADVGGKKEYLRQLAFETIVALVDQVDEAVLREHVLPALGPQLQQAPGEFSPELIALALKIQSRFGISVEELPGSRWTRRLLHRKNLPKLAAILRESTYNHPRVHAVWSHLLDQLVPARRSGVEETKTEDDGQAATANQRQRGDVSLADFWLTVVDEGLFGSTAERKFLGLELFGQLLQRLPPERLPLLFTKHLVRCLINQLRRSENYLHAAALKAVEQVHRVAANDPAARLAIAMQLLGEHGSRQFDLLTQTDTVQRLLVGLGPDEIAHYAAHLQQSFLHAASIGSEAAAHARGQTAAAAEGEAGAAPVTADDPVEARRAVEAYRVWAVDQIYAVLKHNVAQLSAREDVLENSLQFLLFHGVFTIDAAEDDESAPNPPLSERERLLCNKRFFSLLAELNTSAHHRSKSSTHSNNNDSDEAAGAAAEQPQQQQASSSQHAEKAAAAHAGTGLRRDGSVWAVSLLHFAETSAKREDVSEARPLPEEAADGLKQVSKQLRLIRKAAASASVPVPSERAFELLLGNVALQLYSHDADVPDTVSIIQELIECRRRLVDKAKAQQQAAAAEPSAKKRKSAQPPLPPAVVVVRDVNESSPMEVLMDVLISLLSRPSALLREIVDQAFRVFVADMTPAAIQLLVDVITGKSEQEADEASDSEGDDEESEVEVDATGDAPDSKEDGAKQAKKARKGKKRKLAEPEAEESAEEQEASSSEEELITDDAEMEKFDAKLVEMFKEMKSRKRDRKEAVRKTAHFKFRALELVDILLRKMPHSELLVPLVAPLVSTVRLQEAVRGAEGDNLAGRVANVLRKLYHCRGPSSGPLSPDATRQLVAAVDSLWDSLRAYRHKGSSSSSSSSAAKGKKPAAAGTAKTARLPEVAGGGLHFVTRLLVSAARPADVDANSPAGQNAARWLEAGVLQKLSDAFRRALRRLYTRRNASFTAGWFLHFLDREPWLGWACADGVLQGATVGRSAYLKAQSLSMLALLCRKRPSSLDDQQQARLVSLAPAVLDAFEAFVALEPPVPTHLLRDAVAHLQAYLSALVALRQDSKAEASLAKRLAEIIKSKLEPSNSYQSSLPIRQLCDELLATLRRRQDSAQNRLELKRQRKEDRRANSRRRAKRLKLAEDHGGASVKQEAGGKTKKKQKKAKKVEAVSSSDGSTRTAPAPAAASSAGAASKNTPQKSKQQQRVVASTVKGKTPRRSVTAAPAAASAPAAAAAANSKQQGATATPPNANGVSSSGKPSKKNKTAATNKKAAASPSATKPAPSKSPAAAASKLSSPGAAAVAPSDSANSADGPARRKAKQRFFRRPS